MGSGTLTSAGPLHGGHATFKPHGVLDHALVAAAEAFGTRPETLLADRTRASGDARGVAMAAARMRGQSLPQIARQLDRDHTSVLRATRRVERTPALRALAARIAYELPAELPRDPSRGVRPARPPEQVANRGGADAPEHVSTRPSPGARQQRREAPPAAGGRHLQVVTR